MSRIVALSKPSFRKSSRADSRILRPVSSALDVVLACVIILNAFNIRMLLNRQHVKSFLNAFRIYGIPAEVAYPGRGEKDLPLRRRLRHLWLVVAFVDQDGAAEFHYDR